MSRHSVKVLASTILRWRSVLLCIKRPDKVTGFATTFSGHQARELGGTYPTTTPDKRPALTLRHSEHAHLPSNIEKLTLPILGSMFPFWIPTGDLVCQLEPTKYIG
jgi:hypothetical protein